jgi:hypothetical protein
MLQPRHRNQAHEFFMHHGRVAHAAAQSGDGLREGGGDPTELAP